MQHEITARAIEAGHAKATRSAGRLFTLSVLAGAFISLGGILSVIVGYGFPEAAAANPGLQRLLSALMFPLGLFLIVSFGADLFTGNNALLAAAAAERRISWKDTACNWTLVWLGNFAGALLFTFFMVAVTGLTDAEPYHSAVVNIAKTKCALPPLTIFFRAIGANWLVCLAVWLALGAKSMSAKALACWLPVGAFVALGYEHCIANMFFIPCGMLAGADVAIADAAINLAVSTLGNIIGGALLVGTLLHRLYRPVNI